MSYINQHIFNAIRNGDITSLFSNCDSASIRPILPILTQFYLNESLDKSNDWECTKENIRIFLTKYREIDVIQQRLKVDFIKLSSQINEQIQARLKP